MGFHVSERTHENLLNYLYFRSHKGNVRLQGASTHCCMREADFCLGRIMDGSRPCWLLHGKNHGWFQNLLFFFSETEMLSHRISLHFLLYRQGRSNHFIPSALLCRGWRRVSLFPFSMGLFAVHNGLFSKWKTTHFKILEITLKKKSAHGKILAIYALSPCLPPAPPGLQPLFLPHWIVYPGDLLSEVKWLKRKAWWIL